MFSRSKVILAGPDAVTMKLAVMFETAVVNTKKYCVFACNAKLIKNCELPPLLSSSASQLAEVLDKLKEVRYKYPYASILLVLCKL